MEEEKRLIHMPLRSANSSTRKASDFARVQKIVVLLSIFAVACLVIYFASFDVFGPPRLRLSSLYSVIRGPAPLSTEGQLVSFCVDFWNMAPVALYFGLYNLILYMHKVGKSAP